MDAIKTAREIGFFETARNISEASGSEQVRLKIEETMPMPAENPDSQIRQAAKYLLGFGKRKLLLLSPEIALIEALAELGGDGLQVILTVPCDMNPEIRDRLMDNLPSGIDVQILNEPYFPEAFTPANGLIASFGYLAGNRLMVLPECCRMTDHYGSFWGKKVFIPYVTRTDSTRFPGWIEMNPAKFNDVWRNDV